jgi:uncharacterized membrane protein YagU involved in acid resistance
MTSLGSRIVAALVAGGVATYLMDTAGSAIYAKQTQALKDRETEVEPKSALTVLSERILEQLGRERTEDDVKSLTLVIHWAYGIGNGLVYAAADARLPSVSAMFGIPVALVLFTIDELALPALDLTPWPEQFPFGTHVRSFASHLVYGACLAVTYRGLTNLRSSGR